MFQIEDIRGSLARNSTLEPSARSLDSTGFSSTSSASRRGLRPPEPELIPGRDPKSFKDSWNSLPDRLDEPASFDPINGIAAVAIVLSGPDRDLSLCFIERATREGDPWSGHMAFPGGRASESDLTVQAVAERETREEVGLAIDEGYFLGELAYMPVRRLGVETGMKLFPFVYYIGEELAAMTPSDEVAAAFWIPMEHLWSPDSVRQIEYPFNGQTLRYPAIRFGEHNIWGLTYRILTQFSEIIGHPLPAK